MYENIIVGYDGSEPSKAALKETALWAKKHGGKLSLVHVVYFDQEEFAIPPSQLEKRLEAGAKLCEEASATISKDYGLGGRVEVLVREGEPPEVLARVAGERKDSLIALGTFGKNRLKRLLIGSVTSEVASRAPCDVLVVKRPCAACTGTYSSILASFDGSDSARKALSRAVELAKGEGSKLTAMYVIPRWEEMLEFFRSAAIEKSLRAGAEKVIGEAKKIASSGGLDIRAEVRDGDASGEIVSAAGALGSDLIVMGTYGWKGMSRAIMGSTTNQVVTQASVPVLIVK